MASSDLEEPRLRVYSQNNMYSPGEPRSQGQDVHNDPGVPRSQGQDLDDDNPGVPRTQGQDFDDDNPGVPRSQGQDFDDDNPGVPRSQGQDFEDDNPRAPRSQGRDFNSYYPETSSSQGQRQNYDEIDVRSRPGGCKNKLGNRSNSAVARSTKRHHFNSGQYSQPENRRIGSRRRRSSSSSEDSGERYYYRNKRSKLSSSKSKDRDSDILDKFIDILNRVKSSDKPKLNFNNNFIPEFDPMSKEQNVLMWLTKVEECSTIYQWDDRETIHYALPKLTGVAKTWYQGLSTVLLTWPEWKKKLIESFPCREDYAELLTEMLSKKVRYGESLEHYYYAKINLLNRCQIYGKRAVDCILYGIEDRAVRVGAQAAQFPEPEHVLRYFRTVKVGQNKDCQDLSQKSRTYDRKQYPSRTHNNSREIVNANIKCYNCNEIGHRISKCDKPSVKCTYCDKMGHLVDHCFKKLNKTQDRTETQLKERHEKQVAELHMNDANNKYILPIKVNNSSIKCHIDLGSQCSLIRKTTARELNLEVEQSDDLPTLRGIGGNTVLPIGIVNCAVEIQGIRETINLYVVEDFVIRHPVLIGHSFTEKPNIIITKTPKELIIKINLGEKVHLNTKQQMKLDHNVLTPVPVESTSPVTGTLHVNGSLRGSEGKEYYLFPGLYNINRGCSTLLVLNISLETIIIEKGILLTRAAFKQGDNSELDCCSVEFCENEVDNNVNCGEEISVKERINLQKLLSKYSDCFSQGLHDLGFTKITEMVIELEDSHPVVYRPYRMSYTERLLVRNMVQEMLDNDIIRESSSPYASPIVLVQKKTGEKRLCVDYRALNRKTKKDHYPLPRVEDQLDQLSGNTLFTSLDLASGYYQIPISEKSRPLTAFVTPDGQYEYNRMPFGLVNAPSVFQRTINKILSEVKIKYAIVYMDDILIPAKNVNEGLQRLEEVLQILRQGGLTLKLSKCNFFQNQIDFLGFEVSAKGIRPGTRKTDAVAKFPTPSNQHEVRQFLGLSGFFRRFIKGYALITSPLTDLLRKDALWTCGKVDVVNSTCNVLLWCKLLGEEVWCGVVVGSVRLAVIDTRDTVDCRIATGCSRHDPTTAI
ncbi:uncharacterized protein LOC142974176 [Anticarsia gemmatalis]|uniref:uncharacterized protein LOC142974176 n=1 Tax=Anticarsia gemmatalis TaxID=129554 RepID=UPI003F76CDAA